MNGTVRKTVLDDRIPVTLLTGFLGSGKTTLLNRLMKRPEMAGTAILINEFGAVGIDQHLVETLDETTVLLDSGCLCCTMRGDLVKALKQLHERLSRREIPMISRVIVETTGLADPVPVVYTLMEERFVSARYRCDGILTVVDAALGAGQLARHREAIRQVAMADRLLITKSDRAERTNREVLEARLRDLNPGAPRLSVSHGDIDPASLFGAGVYSPAGKLPDVSAWLGEEAAHVQPASGTGTHNHGHPHHGHEHHGHHHEETVTSFTVHFDSAVPWHSFTVAMGRILTDYAPHLLRTKGLMNLAGNPGPVVVQCVQNVAYPPVQLPDWPDDDTTGRLVFIAEGLAPHDVEDIRDRLVALPSDAAAVRAMAMTPLLPTRCWLTQRIATPQSRNFETVGWIVQPRHFSRRSASATANASSPRCAEA